MQSSALPRYGTTMNQMLDMPTQPTNEVSSPPLTCHTRASNATKHPAQILYDAGLMQRRCTKAQKAEDDQHLSEAKAIQQRAAQQGLEQLALMELDAKAKMAEAQTRKPEPPPRPCPRVQYSRKGKQQEDGGEEEGRTAVQEVNTR